MSAIANLFYNIPNTLLFTIMCIFGIGFTVIGIKLVKIFLPIELRLKDNVAIGYLSANTSVLFAVLAGFITLYMLNTYSRAQEISRIEVNKLSDICRDAPRLDQSIAIEIQKEVKNYLETVIKQEWPAMQKGQKVDLYGETVLTRLRGRLIKYKPKNIDQSLAAAEMYRSLEELYDVRDERLAMDKSALGIDIWLVLIIGTLFTIILNFLYGMEHNLHIILAPFVSTIAISLFFIIVTMDRPFRGVFSIKPKEFQTALTSMQFENNLLLANK